MTPAIIKHWRTRRNRRALECGMFSINADMMVVCGGLTQCRRPRREACVPGSGKCRFPLLLCTLYLGWTPRSDSPLGQLLKVSMTQGFPVIGEVLLVFHLKFSSSTRIGERCSWGWLPAKQATVHGLGPTLKPSGWMCCLCHSLLMSNHEK